MTEAPVDVLIPTYNPDAAHLSAALRTLQSQTHGDWKALIHDDCSPNTDTRKIVEPFLSDQRIRFVRSPDRLGIGGNWNACARLTEAPFVAYLFQDDLWAPDYLERALTVLQENPTAGFVSLEHEYLMEGEITTVPLYQAVWDFRDTHVTAGMHCGSELLPWWIRQELTPNIIGEPSFVVMRRGVMTKAGPFLNDMPQFLDVEYWTRLLHLSDWYRLKGNFGSFRVHAAGASAMNQESGRGLFDRLRCFEILLRTMDEEGRKAVREARSTALSTMVTKFRKRLGSGKKVSAQGSGELKRFVLQHPLLTLEAVLRSLLHRESA